MDLTAQQLLDMYRRMREIRLFEDAVRALYFQGKVPGTAQLGQGQEAVAVGVCQAMDEADYLSCTYRGHAQVLARGVPPEPLMAEVLGRRTGISKGKGGSMHFTDLSRGLLGTFAIVGAGIPIAVGAALSARLSRTRQVSVTFFGDGATNIGAFHEALNMAGIWKLPALFVCENNLYGEYSHISKTTPVTDLAIRASAYAMAGVTIDGNDVMEVYEAAREALARARDGQGPTLLECKTYRLGGHSKSDAPTYLRPAEEVEAWGRRDPIPRLQEQLSRLGYLSPEADQQIQEEAQAKIDQAVRFADESPFPDPAEVDADIFDEQPVGVPAA